MAECLTCEHNHALHNEDGTCSVPGCSCDALRLPEFAPDVPPPKPGTCMHLVGGAGEWLIEEVAEVDAAVDESSHEDILHFTACDIVGKGEFCTYPYRVRAGAIVCYHEFLQPKWDAILEKAR